MTYIINPAFFYWVEVIGGLKITCGVLFAVVIILAVSFACAQIMDNSLCEDDEHKALMKLLAVFVPVCVVLIAGLILIPSRRTLYAMQIAKIATVENVEWTVEAIKDVVDYFINALASVR